MKACGLLPFRLLFVHAVVLLWGIAGLADAQSQPVNETSLYQAGAVMLTVDVDKRCYEVTMNYDGAPVFKSRPFSVYAFGARYIDKNVTKEPQEDGFEEYSGVSFVALVATAHSLESMKQLTNIECKRAASASQTACSQSCLSDAGCTAYEFTDKNSTCYHCTGAVPLALVSGTRTLPQAKEEGTHVGLRRWKDKPLCFEIHSMKLDDEYRGYKNCASNKFKFHLDDHADVNVVYAIYNCEEAVGYVFQVTLEGAINDTATDVCIFANDTCRATKPPFCATSSVNIPFPDMEAVFPNHTTPPKTTTWTGEHAVMLTHEGFANQASEGGPYMVHLEQPLLLAPAEGARNAFIRATNSTDSSGTGTRGHLQAGLSGLFTHLPSGAHFSFFLCSGRSFMDPLLRWGKFVQRAAAADGRQLRWQNDVEQRMGYWTDRRSFYSESWFAEHQESSMLETLKPVQETFEMARKAVSYFYVTRSWASSADENNTNVHQCVHNMTPSSHFGPENVTVFAAKLKCSVMLILPLFCQNFSQQQSNHRGQDRDVGDEDSMVLSPLAVDQQGQEGRLAMPRSSLEHQHAFWRTLLSSSLGLNRSSVVLSDVLFYMTLFPQVYTQYDAATAMYEGLGQAAQESGVMVALNAGSPRDVLEAVWHPSYFAVATGADIRALDDPLSTEDFGLLALAAALNLSLLMPSLRTGQNVRDAPSRATLASLARSTAGFGDEVLRTDPQVYQQMVRGDNLLLWPTYSAMPLLDPKAGLPAVNNQSAAAVVAVTVLGEYLFYTAFYDGATTCLQRNMLPLMPDPDSTDAIPDYVGLNPGNASGCCDGCPQSSCVVTSPFDQPCPTEPTNLVWVLAPLVQCGSHTTVLLGEIGKTVSVSETRFKNLTCDIKEQAVYTLVEGAPGEVLTLMFGISSPENGNVVQHVKVVLGSGSSDAADTANATIVCTTSCAVLVP